MTGGKAGGSSGEAVYNVGIYCRLSNDDERGGQSLSIENQRLLLENYVRQQGWNEVDVYIDDGYSGTNFNRPGVKRLIDDAKAKRINVIIVKDLSRFGRNYIEFGRYTDDLFPSIGCRFIALNNGIDTMSDDAGTDLMCFLNLFNDFYSRDTSKKVKAVKQACAKSGKFMGTYPAYGYKRDPMNKHHLVIDEETAPVVRRMFTMRASGLGFRKIADMLNKEGILTPGSLYYERAGRTDTRRVNHRWADTTVKSILRNEVYLGSMVQGKSKTLSYKNHKLVSRPKDEWIRVEHTHEALISREIWDIVSAVDEKKVRKSPSVDGRTSLFTGLLYCGDCGFKMRAHTERRRYKDGSSRLIHSFICGNYARSGKTACSIHLIYEDVLKTLVLKDIRETLRLSQSEQERPVAQSRLAAQSYPAAQNRLARQVIRLREQENRPGLHSGRRELELTAARLLEVEQLMQKLYEDQCKSLVTQEVFKTLMRGYEAEWTEKSAALPKLEQRAAQFENSQDTVYWAERLRRYMAVEELDESLLFGLIDRIEVGAVKKQGSSRTCDIRICYRCAGSASCTWQEVNAYNLSTP